MTGKFSFFLFLLLVFSCRTEEESPVVTDAQLLVSPGTIEMNAADTGIFYLSVQPDVAYNWQVTNQPGWINIPITSGKVDGQPVAVIFTIKEEGLEPGLHTGDIEILSNGAGVAKLTVNAFVAQQPKIDISDAQLWFGPEQNELVFSIINSGTGILHWEITSHPDWISFNTNQGSNNEGESAIISVFADRTGLAAGTQSGEIVIQSNDENEIVKIEVNLEVPLLASLSFSPDSLLFGYFEDGRKMILRNNGNVPVSWIWESNGNAFLEAIPSDGSLIPGEELEMQFVLDRNLLATGDFQFNTQISLDNGTDQIMPVRVKHYIEEKWLLTIANIIDAEYDRNADFLYFISESPNELVKFSPVDKTEERLSLPLSASCLSLGQDGKYAVVGHDGSFSYVDLINMEILQNYPVTTDVFDIILAPNGWVYAMPAADQWVTIRCVELSSGLELPHIGNLVREGTKVKLHPSGKYIYGANNGLSPSDFEKYDISSGQAVYLYDSPYHGDFDFSGDIWINEEGDKLFAKSRNIFNATEVQSTDMTYAGSLSGDGNIVAFDVSKNAAKIFTVLSEGFIWDGYPGNVVNIYDTDFFNLLEQKEIPGFLVPDGAGDGNLYDAEGHFGFFDDAGTHFYLLVKAHDPVGGIKIWAFTEMKVN